MSPTWARGFLKATTGATKLDTKFVIKALHVSFAWNSSFTAHLKLLPAGSTRWWGPAAVHLEACLTRCAICRPIPYFSLPPFMKLSLSTIKDCKQQTLIIWFITSEVQSWQISFTIRIKGTRIVQLCDGNSRGGTSPRGTCVAHHHMQADQIDLCHRAWRPMAFCSHHIPNMTNAHTCQKPQRRRFQIHKRLDTWLGNPDLERKSLPLLLGMHPR
jgi:hypothetical protein